MIEPTEEIQRAYAEAWFTALGMDEQDARQLADAEVREPMPWRIAALKAALAIAERDRCMEPRGHVFQPLARGREWPLNCGGMHPHYCASCSDGHAKGDGCLNCRQTGYDQTPWPNCGACSS